MIRNPLLPSDIPDYLPADMEREISMLRSLPNKDRVLHAAYQLLAERYRGFSIGELPSIPTLLDTNVVSLWSKRQKLYCTGVNYLLRIILIKTGKFQPNDLEYHWTILHGFSPHQYVRIHVDGKRWINVDIWANEHGLPFGDHAHGFHSRAVTD